MRKINQFKEDKLPDFLEELKKENPFKTPHNYFHTLPDQIMHRIQEERTSTPQSWWQILMNQWPSIISPKPVWVLAVLVVVTGIFFFNTPKSDPDLVLAKDFTSLEIAQYVQNHIDDFEVSDFYAHDLEEIEILGESLQSDEIEPLLDDLMDDMDLETLQRIL